MKILVVEDDLFPFGRAGLHVAPLALTWSRRTMGWLH